PDGLHVYDGHTSQPEPQTRQAQVDDVWRRTKEFVRAVEDAGLPVPRIVCGGTGSFPMWAAIGREEPRIEASPGTFFLNDWGYFRRYPDLPYFPAAVLFTRVVSKPRPGRLTLDLGSKAVAPDSDVALRAVILDLPDAAIVGQSEEHLVVETSEADRFEPGDLLYAWPNHICPTCALHKELLVVEQGKVAGSWPVAARDRVLGV
ncbi:MAG TPA: D-TA family PLP-dependent enzyme, partial [Planctomycetia bacterium]|nr:D-TA family PLP-dependent enzyme [Planctomycetia bacterium]